MTQCEKLFLKLMNGSPITHEEATKLLSAFGYKIKQGRGSRVKFIKKGRPPIQYHTPHGGNKELKGYILADIRRVVSEEINHVE